MPPINQANVLAFLKKLGILAGLAAANAILVLLIATLSNVNIATLPVAYQAAAYTLIPLVLAAFKWLLQDISTLEQVNQAKADSVAQFKNSSEFQTLVARATPPTPSSPSPEMRGLRPPSSSSPPSKGK